MGALVGVGRNVDGAKVGSIVGLEDGMEVGFLVGTSEGGAVGVVEGLDVGLGVSPSALMNPPVMDVISSSLLCIVLKNSPDPIASFSVAVIAVAVMLALTRRL